MDKIACGVANDHIFSVSDIEKIVQRHNKYRQRVALGAEKMGASGPQPSAGDMIQIQWDEELAKSARLWAIQCPSKEDECRDVGKIFHPCLKHKSIYRLLLVRFPVTQNVGSFQSNTIAFDIIIDIWYEEVEKFDQMGTKNGVK